MTRTRTRISLHAVLGLALVALASAPATGHATDDHAKAEKGAKTYQQLIAAAQISDPEMADRLQEELTNARLALQTCRGDNGKKAECQKAVLAEWKGFITKQVLPWYKKKVPAGLEKHRADRKARIEKYKGKGAKAKAAKPAAKKKQQKK